MFRKTPDKLFMNIFNMLKAFSKWFKVCFLEILLTTTKQTSSNVLFTYHQEFLNRKKRTVYKTFFKTA